MKTKNELAMEIYHKSYDNLCRLRQNAVDSIYGYEQKYANDKNNSPFHKLGKSIEKLVLEWMF